MKTTSWLAVEPIKKIKVEGMKKPGAVAKTYKAAR
jgi:hypothetical protein